MSVILFFLLAIAIIAGWWLIQHGLFSKPWLENGAGVLRTQPQLPLAKFGLGAFLAVVGCLFALFGSAYFMRMEYSDWRNMPLPNLLWLNTFVLIVSSASLQSAVIAVRKGDMDTVRIGLGTSGVASVAFLIGQLLVWRELADSGYLVTENPANSFFYLITAMHGLHIVGGLVALTAPVAGAWHGALTDRLRLRIELCATYWHFLLLIWIALLVLFLGWASDFVNICRQILT